LLPCKWGKRKVFKVFCGVWIEILINKQRQLPNEEWLNFAQTGLARDKIKQSLRKKQAGLISRLWNRGE